MRTDSFSWLVGFSLLESRSVAVADLFRKELIRNSTKLKQEVEVRTKNLLLHRLTLCAEGRVFKLALDSTLSQQKMLDGSCCSKKLVAGAAQCWSA